VSKKLLGRYVHVQGYVQGFLATRQKDEKKTQQRLWRAEQKTRQRDDRPRMEKSRVRLLLLATKGKVIALLANKNHRTLEKSHSCCPQKVHV